MKNSILSLASLLVFTFTLSAQAQAMSPTEIYLAYHKALIAASKLTDIFPYYRAEAITQFKTLPAKNQAFLFEKSQHLAREQKGLKIVSEAIKGKSATVATAYCSEGKRGTSKVLILLEGTAWKIGNVQSKISLKPCN